MAARLSDGADALRIVERADELRAKALHLADADAAVYREVIVALALPRSRAADRKAAIEAALERAAEVPGEIARVARTVAADAATLVSSGNSNLRGDAATGALLAAAAARAASLLVAIDLAHLGTDDRTVEAASNAGEAAACAGRAALGAVEPG